MLQKLTATILQSTVFILRDKYTYTKGNKNIHIRDKVGCLDIKLVAWLIGQHFFYMKRQLG